MTGKAARVSGTGRSSSGQGEREGDGEREGGAVGEGPMDLVSLATNTLGNRSLQQEVLRLFLSQSDLLLERAEAATSVRERQEHIHTLKGSARGVGARLVAVCCEAAEAELKAGAEPSLGELMSAVEETNRFIRALLKG